MSAVDAMAADLQTADDAIDDHTEQICGAFVGDADADEPFDPGAVSIRDQTIGALQGEGFSQSEAECLVDGIDFTDPGAASSVEQIAPVFESCGIELARLDDLGG